MTFRQTTQHGLLGRLAPVLTLFAAGCSLIVPLEEYVGTGTHGGGTSSGGGTGGSGGNGGSDLLGGSAGTVGGAGGSTGGNVVEVGGSGTGALGGSEAAVGGTGETGGSNGGTDNGSVVEGGGVAGEPQGGDGAMTAAGGTAGSGTGETGGLGGLGGSLGLGGSGGMGGMSGAGCGRPDFMSDPENCGSCGHVCDADQECLAGYCASSPCDGVCAMYKTVMLKPGNGYRQDGIGTGEVCTEIYGYAPRSGTKSLICWNFASGRTLQVNGKGIPCDFQVHAFDVPLRRDGLCVRVTAGNQSTAGFELPN